MVSRGESSHQKLKKSKNGLFQSPHKKTALLPPRFGTSNLQNNKRMNLVSWGIGSVECLPANMRTRV